MLALFLLVIFLTLAVAMSRTTNLQAQVSDNTESAMKSQLAAESGITFALGAIRNVSLEEAGLDTLMDDLAAALTEGGCSGVSCVNEVIAISPRSLGNGEVFAIQIQEQEEEGQTRLFLVSTGSSSGITRTISIDLLVEELNGGSTNSALWGHGVISKGALTIDGTGRILGMDYETGESHPEYASVLVLSKDSPAASLKGSPKIDGELYLSAPDASYLKLSGRPSVGGVTWDSWPPELTEALLEKVHFGVEYEIPAVDTSPLAVLATNDYDSYSHKWNEQYENIRISAGKKVTISGSSSKVINGIIYLEDGASLTLAGDITFNGIIVTAQPTSQDFKKCEISIGGAVRVKGVEALPNLAKFEGVKALEGNAILAPGYTVKIAGSGAVPNGAVVADAIDLTGNGDIKGKHFGPIMGINPEGYVKIGGSGKIYLDRPPDAAPPACFVTTGSGSGGVRLIPVSGTYTEHY